MGVDEPKLRMETTVVKKRPLQGIDDSSEDALKNVLNLPFFTRKKHYPDQPKPMWQIAQELMADFPPEAIAQLPRDGAEQHDHYIYGIPKKLL